MDNLGANFTKEVLWTLASFVCDGKESGTAFVDHPQLTQKVIDLNSSEIHNIRHESCWVIGNFMDEANVEDLQKFWD